MNKIRTILIFLFLKILLPGAKGNDTLVKYLKFESLTINDGLSQGMVNCIIQDSYGFMWIATKDGLNRYDGYKFTIFKHDISDSTTIADNFIQTIFEDSKGRLWIGTATKGLDLFNRESETFTHFKHDENNPNTLANDQVVQIKEDLSGDLWVSSLRTLCKLKMNYVTSTKKPLISFQLVEAHRNYIFVSKTGNVYLSNWKKILVTGKSGTDSIDLKTINPFNKTATNISFVRVVMEDTLNNQLYYIFDNCITRLDQLSGKIEFLSQKKFHIGMFNQVGEFDDEGKLWLADFDWLLQFDPETREMQRILSDDPTHKKMLDNVLCVYKDHSGIFWIGTKGYGILKYNPRSEKFHHTDESSILSMSSSLDGKILFCKEGTYLYKFDPVSASVIKTLPDESVLARPDYISGGIIEAGLEIDSGVYWIGKKRMLHYDETKRVFKDYLLQNEFTFPIFKDRLNQIWCGGENAFYRYDIKADSFLEYPYPIKTSNFPYRFLEAIYQDSSGIFWLGTTDGLFRFDHNNQSWKQYKNIRGDSLSLSADVIFSICADPQQPDNILWIGTNGGGLNRFEISTGKVIRFSEKDGLPNEVIYGILNDNDGNLWMSSNKGLSKFNIEKKVFRNFELRDGLQSNEFNRNAYCKLPDGTLCFGGVNGFNYFKPEELLDNIVLPQIILTDVKLSNQSVSFKTPNAVLKKPAYLTRKIVLTYGENMISFDFASTDFTAPQKNLYRYKLEGFSDEWINNGINHTATFTNLDPGDYTFKVTGSNSDEVWNSVGTSVMITILPPWYMTWWFRLAVLAMITAGIYFFYRYRLQQVRNLQSIRNRIARDLHDEIGSTLLSISLYSDVAGKIVSEKAPEAKGMLTQITESTTNMMEAMSDIVWAINTRNDRFDNMLNRMRGFAVEILEAKNCLVHFNADESMMSSLLGMEQRKNLYLIFKESINNAAKHANCKNVWIDFYTVGNKLHLKIRDDGKGFIATQKFQGNGLVNFYKRTQELRGELKIITEPGKGTTIALAFRV